MSWVSKTVKKVKNKLEDTFKSVLNNPWKGIGNIANLALYLTPYKYAKAGYDITKDAMNKSAPDTDPQVASPTAVDSNALAGAMEEEEQRRKKKKGYSANILSDDFRLGGQ